MTFSSLLSLQNKLDDLTTLLANLDIRFSIVGITSTGTILFTKTAHLNQAVVLDYTCQIIKIRDDISGLNDGVMETLFIEIIRPHGKILL